MTHPKEHARPLDGGPDQLDPVMERIGDRPIVLIGEASHGTHEFYEMRAELTRRLIVERGFAAVVAEADWPDAYRINRYVRGEGGDATAEEALRDFRRFPTWMWRNVVVEDFARWLRLRNEGLPPERRAGFYGMDLYSMYRSIAKVLEYLDEVDPEAAARARDRYSCFGYFGGRAEIYGQAAGLGLSPSCEQAAVAQLLDMRERAERDVVARGLSAVDEQFFAEHNALVVKNAEAYYRGMFGGRANTWNMRDRHMVETCEALRGHLGRHAASDKIVVWAHNSHVGDARASEWARVGQIDVGQLMRERHGDGCVIVGFTTHSGTVTAASNWDGPAERKRVRPSLEGSWERTLHEVGLQRFSLSSRDAADALDDSRLERAIGVIYRPQTERQSHYFQSRLGQRFDVIVHFDETRALEPLERWPAEERREPAETYPYGL
jgi:erythromycin esterase-like protein